MAYSADTFTAGEVPTTAKWNKLWGNDADFDSRIIQAAPVGEVTQFAGSSAPTGWLLCDGSAVSRTTYAALFAIIGTTYGSGNGSTTFNLPNLKGRVIVGRDAAQTEFDVIGETGGEKAHTQTTAEMATHSHSIGGGQNQWVRGGSGDSPASINQGGSAFRVVSGNCDTAGSSTPFNVLQPYMVMNHIIKI